MNFDDTPQEAAFRAEVRAWIDANAPKHLFELLSNASYGAGLSGFDVVAAAKDWQRKKADAGWACPHWPKAYGGRDATSMERVIWQQEEGVYGMLGSIFSVGHSMVGPTIMAFGSEEQKNRFVPPIATGEEVWCQLFSEPAGGSDLAGLRTRAELSGEDWVINGQKIWTSGAHYCDFGILIARTDPTLPKHKGLTMFLLDMKSSGVELRPIKQANGRSDFNEVYFTDVRISDDRRLGPVNEGWQVSLTTLMNERLLAGLGIPTGFTEIFELCCRIDTGHGLAVDDRAVRSKLATWAVRNSGLHYTVLRSLSALSRGETPGPENSIGKLVAGSMVQDIAMFALDLEAQSGALVDPTQAAAAAKFQSMLMRSPGTRVEGGTDEILRNIIAERVLGLPPDIRVDKIVPFNQIPTRARN